MLLGVGKTAEIDDMSNATLLRGRHEVARTVKFDPCVSVPCGHVMNKIIGSVDSLQCAGKGGGGRDVSLDHFDMMEPTTTLEPKRVPGEATDTAARVQ